MTQRSQLAIVGLLVIVGAANTACGRGSTGMTELQRVKSAGLDVVLLSPHDALRHGTDELVMEFRGASGTLVDVGTVRAKASMPMPGMPMFGSIDVKRADVPGRYLANVKLEMAGTWRIAIDWDGPQGAGSVTFSGTVQ